MLIACWSAKGGAGTTVVAASLALVLAADAEGGARLADLAGDVPAVLGLPEPDGPGLAGWLAAGDDVPVDALARLESPVTSRLALLARGPLPLEPARASVLAGLLGADPRPTVVDCGARPEGAALEVAASASRSLLVTRPCFVSIQRATTSPLRPTGIVLVVEPGRSLTRHDIAEALGVAVVAEIQVDPAVARAVDAGLLARRLPRGLAREVRNAA